MAKALAPEIAVNAVAPGMIDLGREIRRRIYAPHGQTNSHAAQRTRRRNRRAVLFFATAPQFIPAKFWLSMEDSASKSKEIWFEWHDVSRAVSRAT